MRSKIFLLLFFITASWLPKNIYAQTLHRQVKWNEPVAKNIQRFQNEKVLSFDGAVYNADIPLYVERFPVANSSVAVTAQLSNMQFEPLKDAALLNDGGQIGKDIDIKTEVVIERKKAIAQVIITPVRKVSSSVYEKLVSFDLRLSVVNGPSKRIAARNFAHSSVLATGTWYKIGVTGDGIYRLTYNDLKALGIDADAINPQNIRIYGNGGGMLPFLNSAPRYDDLQENAIYVEGASDGKFDKTDFVLFYGQGPTRWTYGSDSHYHHQVNWYTDTTYYFINTDLGAGKRIQSQSSLPSANVVVTSFDDYAYHELEAVNWLKSGREWFGEQFDEINNTQSFQFNFPNHIDSVYLKADAWVHSVNYNSRFDIYINGNDQLTLNMPPTPQCYFCTYALNASPIPSTNFITPDNISVTVKYFPDLVHNPQALGWLNYLELNAKRSLTMSPNISQLPFRNAASVGSGQVAEYRLAGSNAATQVWDVTNRINVSTITALSNTGGTFIFRTPADTLHEYIASNGNNYYSAALIGKIENQNLHGLLQSDVIIVAHPNFINAAQRLASFHRAREKFKVQVVTPQQIYNEFSSGAQDVSAMRDFMKMFYDRSTGYTDAPKYLLLMGRGSYDPKHRVPNNTNYIIAYESANSSDPTNSYMSDDFFTFLDDNEGLWDNGSTNLMDLSVGRLPAKSAAEADAMVNKIEHYADTLATVSSQSCTNNGSSSYGDWRNIVCFVADDEDSNIHMSQAEYFANLMTNTYKDYNVDKIYLDSYKQVATPGGDRYPDARDAITKRVQRGCLLMDYIGHGGGVGWAEERVLEIEDINGWTNYDRLTTFLTATCDFSSADDPSSTSAGELVLLNTHGGGVALFTTTRLAYSQANFELGKRFFAHAFIPYDTVTLRMPTMGEICMKTKNEYPSASIRNFIYLGDPALTLDYPKWNVTTTIINGDSVGHSANPDTIKALQKVTISGYVDDGTVNHNKLTRFNGVIYPTVYDKSVIYHTLANDAASYVAPFQLQKSILYKGAATVVNGNFTFTFVVPKDISYVYGPGRLSYYANDQSTDANGYYDNFIIGGVNANAAPDTKGPSVKLYMNDSSFVFGGLTNQSPTLIAKIIDSSGVSTVGNGIGHDITAELDDDNNKIYVLNDYYQADLNSYQSGKVTYAFSGLAAGAHSLKFKVWDVYNNSTEARLDFVVSDAAGLVLTHVLNYPNPFTTHTSFFFEHNKPCMPMVVQVQIYTVSGKLIKTIRNDVDCNGYRSDTLSWDGLDDYGDRIGRGVYVYHLTVHAADGSAADKYEKLVVLR